MRNYLTVIAGAAVCGFLLAGCHDDPGVASPSSPPAPSAIGFEAYAAEVIQVSTCENTAPVETNNIDFSFSADQDTAVPRDVSGITPSCA